VLRDRQAKTKPDEGIFSGDAAHFLERHRHHKDTRNNHIAHSPNASDVTGSAAWIRVYADEPDIRRVGAIHAFRSSDDTDDVGWMVKMVTHAGDPRAGHGLRANGSRQQWARRARWPAPQGEAQEAEAVDRVLPMGPEAAATPRE
jgi:hypothetical protein